MTRIRLFRRRDNDSKSLSGEPIDYGGLSELEVKGEASYQSALEAIAGPKTSEGCDKHVQAILQPDPQNPYDSNAVKVIVDGHHVGFVNRAEAERIQGIALRLQERTGRPVAVNGRIIGGWKTDDDEGNFGIWLYYDPERFC